MLCRMRFLAFVFIGALLLGSCGGTPASPSGLTLAGTWSGSSADSTGSEAISWTVTQNGSGVTGPMGFSDPNRGMTGTGSMSGTINGQTITFQMNVASGGFGGMMSSCSMMASGQATMSPDGHTMTGSYTGNMSGMMSGGMMNQSCGGTMNGGHFTMTR